MSLNHHMFGICLPMPFYVQQTPAKPDISERNGTGSQLRDPWNSRAGGGLEVAWFVAFKNEAIKAKKE